MTEALNNQVGGDHYKNLAIQPFEYITKNNLGFAEGSVIKYVTRWRSKNGVEDLKKARHFLELLIDMEYENTPLEIAPTLNDDIVGDLFGIPDLCSVTFSGSTAKCEFLSEKMAREWVRNITLPSDVAITHPTPYLDSFRYSVDLVTSLCYSESEWVSIIQGNHSNAK